MNHRDQVECVLDGYGLVRAMVHQHRAAAVQVIDGMTQDELRGTLAGVISFASHVAAQLAEHSGNSVDSLLDLLSEAARQQ